MGEYIISELTDGFKWTLVVSGVEIASSTIPYSTHLACEEAIATVMKHADSPIKQCEPLQLDFSNFIGRKVVVTDRGESHDVYYSMFEKLGFKYPHNRHVVPHTFGFKCTIFNATIHPQYGTILFALERCDNGEQYLVGYPGVKFI